MMTREGVTGVTDEFQDIIRSYVRGGMSASTTRTAFL
jgi:hypothetical protein